MARRVSRCYTTSVPESRLLQEPSRGILEPVQLLSRSWGHSQYANWISGLTSPCPLVSQDPGLSGYLSSQESNPYPISWPHRHSSPAPALWNLGQSLTKYSFASASLLNVPLISLTETWLCTLGTMLLSGGLLQWWLDLSQGAGGGMGSSSSSLHLLDHACSALICLPTEF